MVAEGLAGPRVPSVQLRAFAPWRRVLQEPVQQGAGHDAVEVVPGRIRLQGLDVLVQPCGQIGRPVIPFGRFLGAGPIVGGEPGGGGDVRERTLRPDLRQTVQDAQGGQLAQAALESLVPVSACSGRAGASRGRAGTRAGRRTGSSTCPAR